jgi:hypothetical protein
MMAEPTLLYLVLVGVHDVLKCPSHFHFLLHDAFQHCAQHGWCKPLPPHPLDAAEALPWPFAWMYGSELLGTSEAAAALLWQTPPQDPLRTRLQAAVQAQALPTVGAAAVLNQYLVRRAR